MLLAEDKLALPAASASFLHGLFPAGLALGASAAATIAGPAAALLRLAATAPRLFSKSCSLCNLTRRTAPHMRRPHFCRCIWQDHNLRQSQLL